MKLFFLLLALSASTILLAQNCSNTIHNTLPPDATNRSPTECEVKFDWKVRNALHNALAKSFAGFPDGEWEFKDTAIQVLKEVGKNTEDFFFGITYYFKIDLNPASPRFKPWYDKYQAIMEELKSASEATYKKFVDHNYQMNNAIHIKFYISVNSVSHRIYFYKGGQQQLHIPHTTYAVKGPYVAPFSGGDVDNSTNGCLILLGKSKITTQKESGGGSSVAAENIFPKGTSHLTVQNIAIRIECNDELLDKILKHTDFQGLANLIGK